MRITIPDDIGEALQQQLRGRQTLDELAATRLAETLHAPGTRVVLSQDQLTKIAEILGTQLPITSLADLLRACASVGQLHLESTRLHLTPPQLRLIQERAAKSGDTLPQFVARIASKLLTDVFLVQPATEGVFAPSAPLEESAEEYVDGPEGDFDEAAYQRGRGFSG